MRFFHIGIRADRIMTISRSESDTEPTLYILDDGTRFTSSGEWQENAKAVDDLLADLEIWRGNAPARFSDNDLAKLKHYLGSGASYMNVRQKDALRRLLSGVGAAK